MRRLPIVAILVALALAATACSSASAPAWTYAPPTPAPTAGPSGSAGPSGVPSAAPSGGAASGEPSAAPSGGGGGEATVITALNLQFTTPEVSAPASVPFVIEFRNEDAGQPHNVAINDSGGVQKFMGPIVTGVTVTKYDVPALDPGSYTFVCTVHANMKGTLKVGA